MKKFINKLKKGFTLVELAIVIAVIAILVAVLVPTFVALIDKANESSDKQLVKNLNTALSISDDAETMSEALAAAEASGIKVENCTPTTDGYDIVWDQVDNKFLLVEDSTVIYPSGISYSSENTYRYWYIVNNTEDYTAYSAKECSLYINTDEVTEVSSKGGVEYAEGITGVSTTVNATSSTQNTASAGGVALASTAIKTAGSTGTTSIPDVIIITNGGDLKVDVSGDATAEHSGTAESVTHNSGTYSAHATVTSPVDITGSSTIVITEECSLVCGITADFTGTLNIVIEDNVESVAVLYSSNVTVTKSGNTSAIVETQMSEGKSISDYVAIQGNTYYLTLADAVTAAKSSGSTVSLMQDVTLTASGNTSSELYLTSGNLTLDLNGKTISGGTITYPVYIDSGASLTINDSQGSGIIKIAGTYGVYVLGTLNINGGTIESSSSSAAVLVYGGIINTTGGGIVTSAKNGLWLYTAQSATLSNYTVEMTYSSWGYAIYCSSCTGAITMNNVTIDAGDKCCGVALLSYSSASMTNCNVTSNGWYCIANNGADSEVTLAITGGTYTATDCTALYLPNYNATTVISNAEITGAAGIEIRGGYLTLNNCTVTGTNSSYEYQSNGGGNTVYGPALAISQHTTMQTIQVTINGGTYTAENAPAITQNNLNSASDDDLAKITLTINGATVSGNSELGDGDIYLENEDKINYSRS